MYTLGIETSCDETSVALLNQVTVKAWCTRSSIRLHASYGGIIPEIASRKQLELIDKVTALTLSRAHILYKDISCVSVTDSPGLTGSLVVGINFAKALALSLGVPLISVNHLHAHLFACFFGEKKIQFPFLGFVISGGHTCLLRVDDFDCITLVGSTRDDACGEALDKVGRYYGLGYPAGPVIDRLYQARLVDSRMFRLPLLSNFDLSYSGMKTKAVYLHQKLSQSTKLSSAKKISILSSFQYAAMEAVIKKLTEAVKKFKIERVACGGGVVANRYLRKRLKQVAQDGKLELKIPAAQFCQDNACQVGLLGYHLYQKRAQGKTIPSLCRKECR